MRPLIVALDVTERCNLKCMMCHFSTVDRLPFPPYHEYDANMPVPLFEQIATEYFPRAWRVALGCAAEPLMHPRFAELLAIAGRYRIPDLWFPTNLLPLTEKTADAIARAGVRTVAVSIDGTTRETYERIRVGATWARLHEKLRLLRGVRRRMIFTWMQANRAELAEVPAFAQSIGARELDVRYVSPTDGVDNTAQFITPDDDAKRELASAARDAVRRGIRLSSYPEFEVARPRPLLARVARRAWRIKAGLDTLEQRRYAKRERENGCGYPGAHYVIRASGAAFPCVYFEQPLTGDTFERLMAGLRTGKPIGNCATCAFRRDAMYRPTLSS
ncbi:MAG TPA: radical SAM protein [Thermoanaerobaculia bacterium]|nr:radical SAM protein [Thermoanaerobaculia bacterium]